LAELALVTGATGFLGSALCRALLHAGYRVRALHRPTSDLGALEGLDLELAVGDILDSESLASAMGDVDYVFHAAAQSDYWRSPEPVLRSAIDGTRNVLTSALAGGAKRAVLTSSVAALGVPQWDELLSEEHSYQLPPDYFIYGYAKRQAEIEALQVNARGLEVVIVNPSVVLGPGDVNQISGSLVVESARGLAVIYTSGGINVIHIQDVAAGHLAALQRGQPGQQYILGGENVSHKKVFDTIAEITGARPPWFRIPNVIIPPLARLVDFANRFLPLPINGGQLRMSRHKLYCDISKAAEQLQFKAEHSFQQAAQETYDWYREHGVIP
jgi:dihydroflavonol-4-reductase